MAKSKGKGASSGAAPSRGSTYGTIHRATPMSLKLVTALIIITGLSVCFWEEFSHTRFEAHLSNVRTSSPGKGYFQNAGGLWLHTTRKEATDAKGVVVFVHGFGSHCGRLAEPMAAVHGKGLSVYCHDMQGFGHSDGERGYAVHFDDYLDDLAQFVSKEVMVGANKGKPLVLVGNSMGSLVAVRAVQEGKVSPKALAMVAPAVAVGGTPVQRLLLPVVSIISDLLPKFPLGELDRSHINANAEDAASFLADKLTYKGPLTARLTHGNVDAVAKATAAAPSMKLPVHMVVPGDDTVCPTAGQKAFYAAIGSKDKSIKEYPNALHAIWKDPSAKTVVPDLAKWVASQF